MTSSIDDSNSFLIESLPIQESSPLESLSPTHLQKMRSHLLLLHRNIYIWSAILLTCVSDLLHCVGWDPISQALIEDTENILLIPAKDLRCLVTGIFISYGRSLLSLNLYDLALTQLSRALSLSPNNRSTQILRIKALSCLGYFHQAKEYLTELIYQELYSHEEKRQSEYRQLTIVSRDGELGLLMLFIDIGLDYLSETGYGNLIQQRVYVVQADGVLGRPSLTERFCQHGVSAETQRMIQDRLEKREMRGHQQREAKDRNYYKNRKLAALSQAQSIIEANRDMMTNFGPVIIA
jgi:tetratricopeptide (TPR) repeat protein